jgi:hypothetical protein
LGGNDAIGKAIIILNIDNKLINDRRQHEDQQPNRDCCKPSVDDQDRQTPRNAPARQPSNRRAQR